MKSRFIIFLIFGASVLGIVYYYGMRPEKFSNQLNSAQIQTNQKSDSTPTPPPVEDFIKQSAREMVDPTTENKKRVEKEVAQSGISSKPVVKSANSECLDSNAQTFG